MSTIIFGNKSTPEPQTIGSSIGYTFVLAGASTSVIPVLRFNTYSTDYQN